MFHSPMSWLDIRWSCVYLCLPLISVWVYIQVYSLCVCMYVYIYIYMYVCVCIYIYIYIYIYIKLAAIVEGNQKAPFSIATTLRCRGGRYSLPWIVPLYPRYIPYIAECLARRYQVPFLKSLVWCDLGLNPGLPNHWWTFYPLSLYIYIYIYIYHFSLENFFFFSDEM